jgi:uncharacterized protein
VNARLIVADAGPLIALAVGGVLPACITLLGGLLVPQDVLDECCADPSAHGAAAIAALRQQGRFQIVDHSSLAPLDPAFAQGLGTGEIAVLAYARAHHLVALIDERRARRVARVLSVPVIGSGALLVDLKRQGAIASVLPVLSAWHAHGYFLAEAVRKEILLRANE